MQLGWLNSGDAYPGPSQEELNHLGVLKAIKRHWDTTPEFKDVFMEVAGLEVLNVDLLWNSPH